MTASMAILHDLEYVIFDVLFVFDVFFDDLQLYWHSRCHCRSIHIMYSLNSELLAQAEI